MHYAQFWLAPWSLCWSPNSALCLFRARSSLLDIVSHKGIQGSTENPRVKKRICWQANRHISKQNSIKTLWDNGNDNSRYHLSGIHYGNSTIPEVKLNWSHPSVTFFWELYNFQLDPGRERSLGTHLTHEQEILTLCTPRIHPECIRRETACLWGPATRSRAPSVSSLHHCPGPLRQRKARDRPTEAAEP